MRRNSRKIDDGYSINETQQQYENQYLTDDEVSYLTKKVKKYIFLVYLIAPISSIFVFIMDLINTNKFIIIAFIWISLFIQIWVIYMLRKRMKESKNFGEQIVDL